LLTWELQFVTSEIMEYARKWSECVYPNLPITIPHYHENSTKLGNGSYPLESGSFYLF